MGTTCALAFCGVLCACVGSGAAAAYVISRLMRDEDYVRTTCTVEEDFAVHVDYHRNRRDIQGFRPVWLVEYRCPTDEGQGALRHGNISIYPTLSSNTYDTPAEARLRASDRPHGSSDTCWCLSDLEPASLDDAAQMSNHAIRWTEPFHLFPTALSFPIAVVFLLIGVFSILWLCWGREILRALGCLPKRSSNYAHRVNRPCNRHIGDRA